MGGRDPFIVLEDADLNLTVTQAARARLLNTGQNCIAAKRFIVVSELAEKFTKLLFKASKKKYYYELTTMIKCPSQHCFCGFTIHGLIYFKFCYKFDLP